MELKTVRVPPSFKPLFETAEKFVSRYFETRQEDPSLGTININGERYVLMRAASLSVNFFDFIKAMYPALVESEAQQAASIVLFDMAHSMGRADARRFHAATGVSDPIAKLSAGPIHFAYAGWAFVDISEKSVPSPDENYYLLYDHPQSFEADSWLAMGRTTNFCACFMNAGYSSGWCAESFGVSLVAEEILCRAKGDAYCRFIMAHPSRIQGFIRDYKKEHWELFTRPGS